MKKKKKVEEIEEVKEEQVDSTENGEDDFEINPEGMKAEGYYSDEIKITGMIDDPEASKSKAQEINYKDSKSREKH